MSALEVQEIKPPPGTHTVALGVIDWHARALAAEERVKVLSEALEFIAEEHDAGRHDGLPEPCPAHDAETMWAVARQALAALQQKEVE